MKKLILSMVVLVMSGCTDTYDLYGHVVDVERCIGENKYETQCIVRSKFENRGYLTHRIDDLAYKGLKIRMSCYIYEKTGRERCFPAKAR